MNLLYQLSDHLYTYHYATNVSLTLYSPENELLETFGPSYPYCSLFQEACGKYCPCAKSHMHACKEADRLGDGYIFSCPAGYILFAIPVFKDNHLMANVLAGPIALDYPDMDLIDETIQKYGLSLEYRSKLYSTYSNAPLIEPHRARYLCKLLFSLISNLTSSYSGLQAYQSAQNEQQSKISEFIQIAKNTSTMPATPYDMEKQLIEDVLNGNREHASALLNEMLGRIYFASGNNIEIIRTHCIELTALLSRAIIENGGNEKDIYQLTDTFLHKLTSTKDLTDLSMSLLEILHNFISLAFTKYKTPDTPALQSALEYINDNYCSDITLQDVADHAGLNPAYLSSLFKKEMEVNFSDYITDKRITQAKFLLQNSNASIIEIAGTLGFQSQSYFSNVFKKYTGKTPKQFRHSL
ncbi:MAG: AraC family transcriptional regulator [Lachnospiraceae bacterium]|nr:AraC family transcriptional regulator [Lachnospiraceae bacterium]